ncbi:MAG TPA: hypothetical protein VFC73_06175 [Syntrophomonadaceae bacterium]|nr:hypothetical protein [Syntrophomonadaceae bacterium]
MNILKPTENDFNFILANLGEDIFIDNNPIKAVITNTTIKTDFNDKQISTLTKINQGDRIKYNNLYWLIISEVNGKRYDKYKSIIRYCNHIIGFKIDNQPVCIPVIIYGSTIGIKTNAFISVPENKIVLTMQHNEMTSKINISDTFTKWGRLYEVEGIDLTQSGLIHLHCIFKVKSNDIEFVCTEATDIDYKPWYIVIEGETELQPDSEYSYIAKIYDGSGEIHDYLNVVWSLDENANSTINSDGILTVHAEDMDIIIYATLTDTNVIGELLVKTQSEEISYSITGDNNISQGFSITYTANKFINGNLDPDAKFNFSIDYQGNNTSVATLSVVSDTKCSIKANSSIYYITLIAEDIDNGEIIKRENIRLKGLF